MAPEIHGKSDWRSELGGILEGRSRLSRAEQEANLFADFLQRVVKPALTQLKAELAIHGRDASLRENPASIAITVCNGGSEELFFRVICRSVPAGILPYAEIRMHKGSRLVKTESSFRDIGSRYTLDDVTEDDIIRCFLKHYRYVLDASSEQV